MRNHNAQHSNGQKQEEQPTANSQQPPATLGAKTTSNALVGGWPGWPVRLPATGRAVMYLNDGSGAGAERVSAAKQV
ncbi:unnamed protein product [Ceratitis capitata]|uniref:(Mediterranean fruit fly) hypothetical protein n=1 Tax=Ceratitis capitata TaxID=7213 RepID=A0A811U3T3_CERCA|nr:unnamed protein product [Ceratitis capitata]